MAVYSLQIGTVSRRAGSSAVRHAAYRAGERLRDERARRVHDYTAKRDVQHREIVAPEQAPGWMRDRGQLWNRVEARERRYDSRLAQEVYVALPRELPPDRRAAAVRDFVRGHFVARGMVADFAVHVPRASDGGEHPHAHILLTTRSIEGDESGLKVPAWNHPREVRGTRMAWERHANRALVRAGSLERVDARSLAVRRKEAERRLDRAIAAGDRIAARRLARRAAALDREPEPALGRAAGEMEKRGRRTRRGDRVREIRERNLRSRKRRLRMRLRETERRLRRRALHLCLGRAARRLGMEFGPGRPRGPGPASRPPPARELEVEPALREVLDRLPDPLARCRTLTPDAGAAANALIGRRIEEILSRSGPPRARSGANRSADGRRTGNRSANGRGARRIRPGRNRGAGRVRGFGHAAVRRGGGAPGGGGRGRGDAGGPECGTGQPDRGGFFLGNCGCVQIRFAVGCPELSC